VDNSKHDVMSVAKRILKILDSGDEKPNLKKLQKIEGVGVIMFDS